jgi:hypothetical protein
LLSFAQAAHEGRSLIPADRSRTGRPDDASSRLDDSGREACHAMAPPEVARRLNVDPVRGLSD